MSHHVGKRSSVGTGRKAPYVEIQRDVGERKQRSEQSKEFKLPKHHKNEPPTIRMEDVPSELTHWIEQGDLDGSVDNLDAVMRDEKTVFSQLIAEE